MHQQGTVNRLLFKGDVVHTTVKGRLTDSEHYPFVDYLVLLLPCVNPQVWRAIQGAPPPPQAPPSAR